VRFGRSVEPGFLQVFSVDTEEEAKRLLVMACQTNFQHEFVARELVEEQTLERLEAFSDRLEDIYKRYIKKEK